VGRKRRKTRYVEKTINTIGTARTVGTVGTHISLAYYILRAVSEPSFVKLSSRTPFKREESLASLIRGVRFPRDSLGY